MTNKEIIDSLMDQHENLRILMKGLSEEDRIVCHKLSEAQRHISNSINLLEFGVSIDRRTIKNHLSDKMFELVQEVIRTEEEMISMGCLDVEEFNEENDVSVWTRPTHPGKTSPKQTTPSGYGEGEPYRAFADTLMREFQNKAEEGLQMRGCSIRIQDNQCHFYISASISLDALQNKQESSQEGSLAMDLEKEKPLMPFASEEKHLKCQNDPSIPSAENQPCFQTLCDLIEKHGSTENIEYQQYVLSEMFHQRRHARTALGCPALSQNEFLASVKEQLRKVGLTLDRRVQILNHHK